MISLLVYTMLVMLCNRRDTLKIMKVYRVLPQV